jgi:membrane-bound metal-dependent hydrolase YbcI (DUF457 family)
MFIGHYAVGLAAKKWAPKVSLGTLFAAAVWLDIVWPIFVLLGWEKFGIVPGITKLSPFDFYQYPLSHSLVMALVWGSLLGLLYLIVEKDEKSSWILGAVVVSHWVLDMVVHRPDLPLLPAANVMEHKMGLGLWNYPALAILLELVLFNVCLWVYLKASKATSSLGSIALWSFVTALIVFYALSLRMTPPNDMRMIALGSLTQLLFVAWGYWIDDHREMA